ncbi:hypothetical protein PG991_008950 [Apiospora marii]|uniref:Uncharacterized protein n=1 Tax=Apiospora marii TaxID=335849 RepID=A0ABR1RKB4_9PEZI
MGGGIGVFETPLHFVEVALIVALEAQGIYNVEHANRSHLEDASDPFSSAAGYRAAGCVPQILPSALAIDAQRGLAGYLTDRPEIVYIAGSSLGSPNLTIIGAVAAAWMPIAFSRDNVTIRSHYSQREHRRISSSILLNWLDNSVDAQIATSCDQEIGEIRMTEPANTIKAGPEHLPCSHAQTGGQVLDYIRQSATRI